MSKRNLLKQRSSWNKILLESKVNQTKQSVRISKKLKNQGMKAGSRPINHKDLK